MVSAKQLRRHRAPGGPQEMLGQGLQGLLVLFSLWNLLPLGILTVKQDQDTGLSRGSEKALEFWQTCLPPPSSLLGPGLPKLLGGSVKSPWMRSKDRQLPVSISPGLWQPAQMRQ